MGHTITSERKKDHIELAFQSVVQGSDQRFYYEPLFNAHPTEELKGLNFVGKSMKAPIWISSMTGGTAEAAIINRNLAEAAGEFGLGMGLGSCRIILDDDTYLPDFQLRSLAKEAPLYANLGIAQVEELHREKKTSKIKELIDKTETDGLILHVNPLQEWLQPEGDRFQDAPLETIKRTLDLDIPIIVKEVGQGFGPRSLRELMKLPLVAIDFGAHGGTNFSKLELHRQSDMVHEAYEEIASWGHTAVEMVEFFNEIRSDWDSNSTPDVIVSGGVRNFLDGYYLIKKINANAVYGQASAFLKHARAEYEELREFVILQLEGLKLAQAYLRLRS